MHGLYMRTVWASLRGLIAMAALLFLPAWTLDYWQAWLFIAVFVAATVAITVYLARNDPKLLERRMSAGPMAEKEPAQKLIMSVTMAGFIAALVVPALDHRFGWSAVPPAVSLAGDALIALGFLFVFLVLKENSYAASTIGVAEGQKVVSTGPYALVRHPMYAGALPLLAGTPLALGSWWGLAVVAAIVPALIWRLLDEERFLARNLAGYADYTRKVKYRLVPGVW